MDGWRDPVLQLGSFWPAPGAGFAEVRGMPSDGHGIIFEMVAIGRYVKVTAVDTRSGTEASIVGDPRRGEQALRQAAARKLRYVMEKKTGGGTDGGGQG